LTGIRNHNNLFINSKLIFVLCHTIKTRAVQQKGNFLAVSLQLLVIRQNKELQTGLYV